MTKGTQLLQCGGNLVSSKGRFAAICDLQWPVVDPRKDSIRMASLKSITGTVVPKKGTPVEVFKEAELVFEVYNGPKFAFSFVTPGTCDIRIKRWVR
jgi:hypothetical protein